MNRFEASHPIALIGGHHAQATLLAEQLRSTGRIPVLLDSGIQFLLACRNGKRFSLLVLVLSGEEEWTYLLAMCRSMCIPTLLLTNVPQRAALIDELMAASDKETKNAVYDFALLPISREELDWRIYTLNQRMRDSPKVMDLVFGGYRFLGFNRIVLPQLEEVQLQPRQFELALLLFQWCGRLLERDQIFSSLWGDGVLSKRTRALDACICSIRRKLSLDQKNGFVLHTVYGRGYMLSRVSGSPQEISPLNSFDNSIDIHKSAAV